MTPTPNACPKCRTELLVPVHEADVPSGARRCARCHGHFLSHDAVEGLGQVVELRLNDAPWPAAASADRQTGLCPDGHGIMRRAKVELHDRLFHLERCSACLGVFFDAGELSTLAAMHLLGRIDSFWDTAEQRAARQATVKKHRDDALVDALGNETFDELKRLVAKLSTNPKRSMAIAYLAERLRGED